METHIQLLFLPPSVNGIYRRTHKGVSRTPVYRKWLADEGLLLNRQMAGQKRWHEPVEIWFAYRRPPGKHDLDNLVKATLDLLQAHEVIENDLLVEEFHVKWSDALANGISVDIRIAGAK